MKHKFIIGLWVAVTVIVALCLGCYVNKDSLLRYGVKEDSNRVVSWALLIGAKTESLDQYGRTPLMIAVFNGNLGNILLLSGYGAKLDAVESVEGRQPVHFASTAKTLRLLIALGANPLVADSKGVTPYILASRRAGIEDNKIIFLIEQYNRVEEGKMSVAN